MLPFPESSSIPMPDLVSEVGSPLVVRKGIALPRTILVGKDGEEEETRMNGRGITKPQLLRTPGR